MDDRICMYYVLSRLDDIIKAESIELSYEMTASLKDELIYNLGVNARLRHGA